MPSLADVFRVLEEMRAARVFDEYAIGGATAVLFYTEPARTYDVYVFVTVSDSSSLTQLSRIYEWSGSRGFSVVAEHIMIHGVPVQFLAAHNSLAEDAIRHALSHDYDGVMVRVIGPEHLMALALQAGGARRRERAWQLLESGHVDRNTLRTLLDRHHIHAIIPTDV